MSDEITEAWLKEVGFKWHQLDRQTARHWVLWLGNAVRANDDSLTDDEDLGLEVTVDPNGTVFCWFRSDAAGRYHRFIHIRHFKTRADIIKLVEVISGVPWDPANHIRGSVCSLERVAHNRRQQARLDRELRDTGHPWSEIEKDDSRGRALPEHMEAHEKAKVAK